MTTYGAAFGLSVISWRFWLRIMDLRCATTKFTLIAFLVATSCTGAVVDAGSTSGSDPSGTNGLSMTLNCTGAARVKGRCVNCDETLDPKKKLGFLNYYLPEFSECDKLSKKIGSSIPVNLESNFLLLYSWKSLQACDAHVIEEIKKTAGKTSSFIFVYGVVSEDAIEIKKFRDNFSSYLTTLSSHVGHPVKGFLPDTQSSDLNSMLSTKSNVTCELISTVADEATTPNPDNSLLNNFSRTSVLFVSVSFIILMVISLAWLVFYYVQRFRYAHAKDRLARRLFNAAKKALTKIPAKTLRHGDRELDSDCPVCIEPYHSSDVIRILPCKHVFHKTCVDPWLLEHRTCPMCKMDILKAFGYNFGHSEESVRDADQMSAGGQSTDGRSAGFPVPLPTDSDLHDPFFPSPAPSPSLLQPVLHSNNTQSFSIIPLTVHSTGARGSNSSADSSDHWVSERHSAEVHRGPLGDNSSAASSSGSDDGHDPRTVTQPLFRPARPLTATPMASTTAIVLRANKNGKNRRKKSTKSSTNATATAATLNTASTANTTTFVAPRPRSASSQNIGSSPGGHALSRSMRNEAAPSLESL